MSVILATNSTYIRGCAAKYSQPLSFKDEEEARSLVDKIHAVNCKQGKLLPDVIYRSGDGERDILRQVFRWDLTPFDQVFQHGIQARGGGRQDSPVDDSSYYDMCSYYNQNRGRPLDSRKTSKFAFISTTVSNSWYPPIPGNHENPKTLEVYRYEIYAPGGIWTSLTVAGKNNEKKFKRLDEVAFVSGIAPQYIRSAQLFRLTGNPNGTTTVKRVDNVLQINGNFNPQSHPLRLLNIENPISDYTSSKGKAPLVQRIHHQSSSTSNPNIIAWYAHDVPNRDIYMSSAFRSSNHNEAYYILQNWCTQLNYDPGGTNDFIVKGPIVLSEMFKSLEYTPFGEHGIDGAIQSHVDEAIIFSANLCALIDYSPNEKKDKILKGPMTIVTMFPFFKGTVFENGIDSASETKSVDDYEALVFKGNLCAHISCGPNNPKLIAIGQIAQMIPSLKGTVFEGLGVDATYASHAQDEDSYYFKFNNYGQIGVNLDDGKKYLAGVYTIGANAAVIHSFVPQKNRGLDMRDGAGALPDANHYDHDEL